MIRVVLDTNILVSAILSPKGKPAKILEKILEDECILITSPDIWDEVYRVFQYSKIKKLLEKRNITDEEILNSLEDLKKISLLVSGKEKIDAIPKDPSDTIFLSAGIEGDAHAIVSGDQHLLELKIFRKIPILKPEEFLDFLSFSEI